MITFGSNPTIQIDCPPGVYVFLEYSATGKSYLGRQISLATEGGLPYLTYTYVDYVRGLDLAAACEKCKAKLVLIDRYGMYGEDPVLQAQIQEISKRAVVLLDWKDSRLPVPVDGCAVICRTEDLLEVSC